MKKLLISALLVAVALPSAAQIVSSKSEMVVVTKKVEKPKEEKPKVEKKKKERSLKVQLKAGVSLDLNMEPSVGYDVSLGLVKPVGKKSLLWMPELGAMSLLHGEHDWSRTGMIHGIQVSPLRFGWKFNVSDNVALVPYLGCYLGCSFSTKDLYNYIPYNLSGSTGGYTNSLDSDTKFDIGENVGIGVIIKNRFTIDLHNRVGFISRDDWQFNSNYVPCKLTLSFGVLF